MSKEMREQMDKFKNLLKEDTNMGNIPTAAEWLSNQLQDPQEDTSFDSICGFMRKFAKLHVQKALESATINLSETLGPEEIKRRGMDEIVMESYPLDNIR